MSFHQYQGPKRFQLYTSDDDDDDDILDFVALPYLFTTTILLQQRFQLPASASASFSFHKLKHRFRSKLEKNILYSTSLDAMQCHAIRECQADRQTDKIHEKLGPNRT